MKTNDPASKWTAVKADETLGQYSVIRTGLNSQVILDFANRAKVTIDSGTKIGISEFTSPAGSDGRIAARVGLKYGSMRLKVDRTRGANDFAVSTAVATLSVRGTDGKIAFSGDKGLFLFGDEGTFQLAMAQKTRYVHQKQRINGNLDRSSDMKNVQRAVAMGDSNAGLTKAEKTNLTRYGSGRGIFGYTGSSVTSVRLDVSSYDDHYSQD